jgi:hypothetical protein
LLLFLSAAWAASWWIEEAAEDVGVEAPEPDAEADAEAGEIGPVVATVRDFEVVAILEVCRVGEWGVGRISEEGKGRIHCRCPVCFTRF